MLDGNDRKELSAVEAAREAHIQMYGSFLYCTERDTLCTFMEGAWETGCKRKTCILDDPDYIALQNRIEHNRKRAAFRKKEDSKAAPIRNQKNMIRSHERRLLDEIHRLEEDSQQAFRDNRPADGETLFNRARIMRGDLTEYIERKKGK